MDDLFRKLRDFLLSLGPDVRHKHMKSADRFSRLWGSGLRKFAYVKAMKSYLRCNVRLDLEPDGDFVVENHEQANHRAIKIRNERDLERAKPLLRECYLSDQ